jgi:hypothetical protein
MNKLLIIILLFVSTQTLSYQERGTNGVAETVFTSVAFYYGNEYVTLRNLMNKECNTQISFKQGTCTREYFDNYYHQSSLIKESIIELQGKINDAEIRNDFSTDEFPIALRNYVRDLSALMDVLTELTGFLSRLSHSMVDTGYNPAELQAGKVDLSFWEESSARSELAEEFISLINKEYIAEEKAQYTADILSSMTRN